MIAFLKSFPALIRLINSVIALYYKSMSAEISASYDDKNKELIAIMNSIKRATNDDERAALIRVLNRFSCL